MEHKLFEGDAPFVSTFEFHADRERAPHLEQAAHRPRLEKAAEFARQAARECGGASVSDLGCGDGGLLSLLKGDPDVLLAWGYDFCPANQAGWIQRGVTAYARDVFNGENRGLSDPEIGTVVVMTEVLEHLADPHGVLASLLPRGAARLVCSSPWNETPNGHSPEHAWAWDLPGYAALIEGAGWTIERHEPVGLFQVVLARR
jgi:hypothetical protein